MGRAHRTWDLRRQGGEVQFAWTRCFRDGTGGVAETVSTAGRGSQHGIGECAVLEQTQRGKPGDHNRDAQWQRTKLCALRAIFLRDVDGPPKRSRSGWSDVIAGSVSQRVVAGGRVL